LGCETYVANKISPSPLPSVRDYIVVYRMQGTFLFSRLTYSVFILFKNRKRADTCVPALNFYRTIFATALELEIFHQGMMITPIPKHTAANPA
jgi:hypothetical protein